MSCTVFVFRLLMKDIQSSGIFEGAEKALFFSHDVAKLDDDSYRIAGRLLSMSLLQGGPGLQSMSEAAYRYWVGLPVPDDLCRMPELTFNC